MAMKGAAGYSTNKIDFGSSGLVAGVFFPSSSQRHGGESFREELRNSTLGFHGVLILMNLGRLR